MRTITQIDGTIKFLISGQYTKKCDAIIKKVAERLPLRLSQNDEVEVYINRRSAGESYPIYNYTDCFDYRRNDFEERGVKEEYLMTLYGEISNKSAAIVEKEFMDWLCYFQSKLNIVSYNIVITDSYGACKRVDSYSGPARIQDLPQINPYDYRNNYVSYQSYYNDYNHQNEHYANNMNMYKCSKRKSNSYDTHRNQSVINQAKRSYPSIYKDDWRDEYNDDFYNEHVNHNARSPRVYSQVNRRSY